MANNSSILIPSTSHRDNKTGTGISFNAPSKQIISNDSGAVSFSDFSEGDIIAVTDSATNDGTYTVVEGSLTSLTLLEPVNTDVNAGNQIITVDHIGRYGAKFKADGYYGYTDGLHTVSYHLTGYVGDIIMQGTLTSSPSASDWFTITGTSASYGSAESSNIGYNFTGNFVWVRIAMTNFTDGVITKALFNY